MSEFEEAMRFSKEALKAQDGKKVPVTMEPGGPIIGEATLRYVPDVGLEAEMKINDPKWVELLKDPAPPTSLPDIFRKQKES